MKKSISKPWFFVYFFSFLALVYGLVMAGIVLTGLRDPGNAVLVQAMAVALILSQMGLAAGRALRASESRIEKLESELRDLKSKLEAQDSSKSK